MVAWSLAILAPALSRPEGAMLVARGQRAESERDPGNAVSRENSAPARAPGAWSLDICRECWRAEFPSLHHRKEGWAASSRLMSRSPSLLAVMQGESAFRKDTHVSHASPSCERSAKFETQVRIYLCETSGKWPICSRLQPAATGCGATYAKMLGGADI